MRDVSLTPEWTKAVAGSLLTAALLFTPGAAAAQQSPPAPDTGSATVPLTPAEKAACGQVIGYAFQNPPVMQRFQQLQKDNRAAVLQKLPDSARARVAGAITKGQGDTLKAIARRQLDPKEAPTFDTLIDFVVAFPDSVRRAVATLVGSGRPITCMS